MIDLRPLLYTLTAHRPDLEEIQAMVELQAVAKEIAQRTHCWTEILADNLTVGSDVVDLADWDTILGTETITLTPLAVRALKLKTGGTWRSLWGVPDLTGRASGRFFEKANGMPSRYQDAHGKFILDTLPDQAYAYQARVAVAPVGHFEVVDFPFEATEILTHGALSRLMMWPGTGLNPQLAQYHRTHYLMGLQGLGMALYAPSGTSVLPSGARRA